MSDITAFKGKKNESKEVFKIPVAKIKEYLLSETHIVGKSKAKFFQAVGFNKSNAKLLKRLKWFMN